MQAFWQDGLVQGRIVSFSAVLFSCYFSSSPLSLSHNISVQQHPAQHWAVITGNMATLVSECVLLYLPALGAASLENELRRCREAEWDPGGPTQTDGSFAGCTIHITERLVRLECVCQNSFRVGVTTTSTDPPWLFCPPKTPAPCLVLELWVNCHAVR